MKALAALIGCGVLCGCAGESSRRAHVRDAPARAYAQAAAFFSNAILYKPKPTDTDHDLAFGLTPLLLFEVPDGIQMDENRAVKSDPNSESAVTLYYHTSGVAIDGRLHGQVSFAWRDHGGPHAVRITLSSGGEPVIWEVLTAAQRASIDRISIPELKFGHPGKQTVIFVAESLERAAAAAYGAPLPGRRYSIESRLDRNPDVVVARVIEDGPLPMGPMIYVSNGGTVTTVLCRCMPAQVRAVTATREYDLRPLEELLANGGAPEAALVRSILSNQAGGIELSRSLRLPAHF